MPKGITAADFEKAKNIRLAGATTGLPGCHAKKDMPPRNRNTKQVDHQSGSSACVGAIGEGTVRREKNSRSPFQYARARNLPSRSAARYNPNAAIGLLNKAYKGYKGNSTVPINARAAKTSAYRQAFCYRSATEAANKEAEEKNKRMTPTLHSTFVHHQDKPGRDQATVSSRVR